MSDSFFSGSIHSNLSPVSSVLTLLAHPSNVYHKFWDLYCTFKIPLITISVLMNRFVLLDYFRYDLCLIMFTIPSHLHFPNFIVVSINKLFSSFYPLRPYRIPKRKVDQQRKAETSHSNRGPSAIQS